MQRLAGDPFRRFMWQSNPDLPIRAANGRHGLLRLLGGLFLAVTVSTQAVCAAADQHAVTALDIVDHLDLTNTDYAHGQGSVTWTGTVASHTDCSGFIDHLLMHDDGLTPDDFKHWLGTRRPTADRYHDAVVNVAGSVATTTPAR